MKVKVRVKVKELVVILVGGRAVGKTTVMQSLKGLSLETHVPPTLGVDFHNIRLSVDTNLRVWEVGGGDRFRFIVDQIIPKARIGLVMLSMHDRESLTEAVDHASYLKRAGLPVWVMSTDSRSGDHGKGIRKDSETKTVEYEEVYEMGSFIGETQCRNPCRSRELLLGAAQTLVVKNGGARLPRRAQRQLVCPCTLC
jgi:GTPase SAR1 family protein